MNAQTVDFRKLVKLIEPEKIPSGWTVHLPSFLHSAGPMYQAELEYLNWMSKINSRFLTGTLLGAGSTKNVAAGIPMGLAAAGKSVVNYDYNAARQRIADAKSDGAVYVANPIYGVAKLIKSTPEETLKEVGKIVQKHLDDMHGSAVFGRPIINARVLFKQMDQEVDDKGP